MDPPGEKLVRDLSDAEEKRPGQARALLFRMLAFLWIFPSLGALIIIGGDFLRWFDSPTFLEGLGRIRFEQWIALGFACSSCTVHWTGHSLSPQREFLAIFGGIGRVT